MPSHDLNPSVEKLAHQLRTPLTSIKMYLDILHEQKLGPLNERQTSIVSQAREDCQVLTQQMDDYFSGGSC